jgi:hypothetical protein
MPTTARPVPVHHVRAIDAATHVDAVLDAANVEPSRFAPTWLPSRRGAGVADSGP